MIATPVLIAGGGPVGLTAALALADAGIAVRVFEAGAAIEQDLRASTFHPPTLDLLDRYGITTTLLRQGLICPHWQVRLHPSGERAQFDLSVLGDDTAHPYRLQCEQWKLSQALLNRLSAYPHAQVEFNAEAKALAQDGDGVRLTVRRPDGEHEECGPYLIGADGARSTVRRSLGIGFAGDTYPEITLLATTDFAFDDALPGLSNVTYCWNESGGNFSLLKVPGRWRVSIYPPEGMAPEDALADDAIEAALQAIVARDARYRVMEKRPYRVHQRIASAYRRGRVLLAGDAAHVNSPAGGMGMNGGVHDALNLADKLARVLRGAPEALLDAYERQRRPVAMEQIIRQADANRARMRERDPAKRRAALRDLQAITGDAQRLRAHLLRTSMIEGLRQAEAIE